MSKQIFTSKAVWNNGIFIVRIFTAIMLYQHGKELFTNKQMTELVNFLAGEKIPSPIAYLAKITELTGCFLIAVGLFTRFITLPLMINMAGVIYTMNNGNIFDGELPFLYILLFAALFFTGPGKWSLDYILFDRKKSQNNKTNDR